MPIQQRIDGEYKRESLVTVELDAFQASLFAPEKLKALEVRKSGILAQACNDVITEQYIVTTRCIQGTWETELNYVDGSNLALPEKVFQRAAEASTSRLTAAGDNRPGKAPDTHPTNEPYGSA